MLLTALATLLVLTGCEILLWAGVQSRFDLVLAPGSVVYVLLFLALSILNIVASWRLARRIGLRLWPDLMSDEQPARPRHRFVRQQQF